MDFVVCIVVFIYKFSIILGGGVCIAWFAGGLVAYCSLARPVWEVAIVVGANLFAFTRVCYWIFRKKRSGGSEGELPEETGKDEAPLTEDLDDYEDGEPAEVPLSPFLRRFLYLIFPLFWISVALIALLLSSIPLLIVLGMIVQTWEFWAAWTTGSEWMRSPGTMIAVVSGFMILACLGIFSARRVSAWKRSFQRFVTSPDEPATAEEGVEEESKEETGRDAGEPLSGDTLAATDNSPPPPPPDAPD